MVVAVAAWAAGCTTGVSTFEIVDHRAPGTAKRYREQFHEAYYRFDEAGNVDIVLRRSAPGRAGRNDTIRQLVHIRGLWRSIPGRTVAHRTQINATVLYCIMSGHTGAAFEGAGSVFYACDRRTGELTGTLELATLRPVSRIAGRAGLFERAELAGTFRATYDPPRVVRIVNEMRCQTRLGDRARPAAQSYRGIGRSPGTPDLSPRIASGTAALPEFTANNQYMRIRQEVP